MEIKEFVGWVLALAVLITVLSWIFFAEDAFGGAIEFVKYAWRFGR